MTPAPPHHRLSALILAAGLSSRMGRFKPLLPLGERCVVERVIDLFRSTGVEEICVVVGHRAEALRPRLEAAGVTIAENPRYKAGMFSSVQAGLTRIDPRSQGFFLLPVDIPLVRPATLDLLMRAFPDRPSPHATIHPVFDGRRGHPPLIPAELIPAIRNHDGAGGLRTILEAPAAQAVEVEVPDRFIHLDMDLPERYEAIRAALAGHPIPDDDECRVLLRYEKVAPPIQRHCRLVAAAAGAIAEALGRAGIALDLRLIRSSALLHDIAKGRTGHARAGAESLRRLHFDRVADIVGMHDDIPLPKKTVPREAEVVFIADKHIRREGVMPMEGRFDLALERFGEIADARQNILRRRETARTIRDRIEARIQRPLADLIAEAVRDHERTTETEADEAS